MGDFVHRPDGVQHGAHWRALRQRWPDYTRVVVGRKATGTDVFRWCREQPGEFYRSEGCEVFYFEKSDTAIFFKLRWCGDDADA